LIVFNIIEGTFAQANVQLEVLMDDHAFPSFVSSKARHRTRQFGETGDAFVREIDVSRITLRLTGKTDKGGEDEEHVIAKLQGPTLDTLKRCLYKPTELNLKGNGGGLSKVVVKLRYLPVKMQLDRSESINNSGTLRVDILDAADLPAADRSGYSDPYCKFKLNGKEVYKTKTQKKTLYPAWNEVFELQVSSRTGANFTCDVYDWDFGDKADFLGSAKIRLETLEPFQPQELKYNLDGKSGVVRLKMLFRPEYVTRKRQGSSTFSGTFAPAGKVVGAPIKGVAAVGGGIGKGASFLKRGITGGRTKSNRDESIGGEDDGMNGMTEPTPVDTRESSAPAGAAAFIDGPAAATGRVGAAAAAAPAALAPSTPAASPHTRSRSFGSNLGGTPKGPDAGTAHISVISAKGYPPGADILVYIRMINGKGSSKEVHKTKAIKSPSGTVEYSADLETSKAGCSADTQFQVVVKDHRTFGSKDLGEGVFFVSDQGSGAEQTVKAGEGSVVLRTSFAAAAGGATDSPQTGSGRNSPDSKRDVRRSLFGKKG
jgi:hypothetical protein